MFRELTRKAKELPCAESIELLRSEKRGILSVIGDDGYPYGMPMNYWYGDDGCIWFHCGKETSHRLDALKRCDKVSFCVCEQGVAEEGDWALKVRSVIVFGRMEIIDDAEMIADISYKLSRQFTDDESYISKEIAAFGAKTMLLKLQLEHICGKRVKES